MDDIELPSRRGLRSRAYDPLPQGLQQEKGLPSAVCPTYEHNVGPMPNEMETSHSQSVSQSDSICPVAASLEQDKLPPKAYRQASTQKRVWIHIANATAFVICLGLPLAVFIPVLYGSSDDGLSTGSTYCAVLSEDPGSLNDSISNILNISVAYGKLSFGMVKFIDLIWDAFVSRGGQVGLGYVAYRVHNAALLRIMEDKLVSYDLYATMTLSWATVWGLRPIVKSFFTNLGFKRKLLLFWVALSVVWVAVWPTITNAMTGYVAKNMTLVRLADGSGYANFSDVANTDTLAFQYKQLNAYNFETENRTATWTGPLLTSAGPNVTLWQDLVRVVGEMKYTQTAIFNISLPDGTSHVNDQTPAYIYYYFRNETYSPLWFQDSENVQCVATSTYQWGFSTGVFLAFTVLNGCWIVGTYGVWLHMNRKSELVRKHRTLGKYRAAVDMVEAVHTSLGRQICAYSDSEIEKMLSRGPGIKYSVTQGKGNAESHIGLSSENDGKFVLNFGELYGKAEKRES